jgi:acetoin utilization deacetylase AcuC-like enzyme
MLYFSHPACLEHDPRLQQSGHPDTPERLLAIEGKLAERDWLGWERREAPLATGAELELIHSPLHVEAIRGLCKTGGDAIYGDTFAGEASYRAALRAVGGTCAMTRCLLGGEGEVGFCVARPAGHHAEPDRPMGFCLFGNVAIAAELAIRELGARRVFVLDWDVHHGNGTAEAFRRRPDVLFASIHQDGIFPGWGH